MRDHTTKMAPDVAKNEQAIGQNVKTVKTSADQKSMEAETKKVIITAINLVAVRQYSVDTAPVVGYVHKGDTVTVLGSEKGYKRIQFGDNEIGYISSNFCKEV